MAYKPVISYEVQQALPLVSQLNVSIVRKKIDKTTYRNWNNKFEFISYVNTLYVHPSSDCYVHIKCQCSTEYNYVNSSVVPSSNVTCSCGRKIIEYGN